ncbi:hypothetical protein TESG_08654 [Trichophyton tonsurans CBS 112818]|uniref:Uncharacterized protein n=1 Tax=Trichophyton tonsurans (strain CBS 112818) TaxID=647933 RepID=F2SA19_TRIT1|nr:hypothetical protein TESG_08654 [Trichophyton tonsurans CBS 112818]
MQWYPRAFLGSGAGVKDQNNPWRDVGSLTLYRYVDPEKLQSEDIRNYIYTCVCIPSQRMSLHIKRMSWHGQDGAAREPHNWADKSVSSLSLTILVPLECLLTSWWEARCMDVPGTLHKQQSGTHELPTERDGSALLVPIINRKQPRDWSGEK